MERENTDYNIENSPHLDGGQPPELEETSGIIIETSTPPIPPEKESLPQTYEEEDLVMKLQMLEIGENYKILFTNPSYQKPRDVENNLQLNIDNQRPPGIRAPAWFRENLLGKTITPELLTILIAILATDARNMDEPAATRRSFVITAGLISAGIVSYPIWSKAKRFEKRILDRREENEKSLTERVRLDLLDARLAGPLDQMVITTLQVRIASFQILRILSELGEQDMLTQITEVHSPLWARIQEDLLYIYNLSGNNPNNVLKLAKYRIEDMLESVINLERLEPSSELTTTKVKFPHGDYYAYRDLLLEDILRERK